MGWTKSGFAVVGVALLLAGCSTGGERPIVPPVSVDRGLSPADYVEQAASLDLLEVKTSQLAFNRSGNARVRDFARMMIDEHTGLAAQLSFAGRRLGLLPSAALLPRHQAMLDGLSTSPDFERAYRSQQGELHRVALRLHSDFAARGASATLRPVAASALAVERRHLAMLQSL
jgi:putative membrane protein